MMIALFPLLSFAAHNPDQVDVAEIATLAGICTGVVLSLVVLARFALGAWRPAAIVGSMFAFVFTAYVPLLEVLAPVRPLGVSIGRTRFLLPLTALASIAVLLFLIRYRPKLHDATLILNVIATALVLVSLGRFIVYHNSYALSEPLDAGVPTSAVRATRSSPDIYYIILDGYARADTLRRVNGFDNSPFIDQLKSRGFVVADDARSNYSMTQLSLSSSLNMRYIGDLTSRVGRDSRAVGPLVTLIQQARVIRFLKNVGYRFVHIGSGWGATARSSAADVNIECGRLREFREKFARSTLLRYSQTAMRLVRGDRGQRERLLCSLRELRSTISSHPSPKFVFAHIVAPHPPFVVGPHGERVSTPVGDFSFSEWARRKPYTDQVRYLNSQLTAFVDSIKREAAVDPVVLLQADHGTYASMARASSEQPRNPSDEQLQDLMGIFSAYLLPGDGGERIKPSTTPVNSFRVVLDALFDTDLGLLTDRSYYSHPTSPYDFVDVTGRLD